MISTTPTDLHRCAQILAGLDLDRAEADNGIGYSKSDGSFGHLLAVTPPEAWSPDVIRGAYVMLRRYRGQLSTRGIDFDQIPEPHPGDECRDLRAIDHDGDRFVLRFPYNAGLIEVVKGLPGRRWDPTQKVWTAPLTQSLVDFIEDQRFTVTDSARSALDSPVPTAATTQGYIEQRGPRLVVHSEYNPALIEQIRALPGRRWDPEGKVWTTPLSAHNALRYIAEQYHLEWRIVDVLDVSSEPSITVLGGRFVIRSDYDRDLVQQIREIPGSQWDRRIEAWTVPLEAAIDLVDFVEQHRVQTDQDARDALAAAADAWARVQASAATDAVLVIPGLGGDLLPFQRAGVRYALDALGYVEGPDGRWVRGGTE